MNQRQKHNLKLNAARKWRNSNKRISLLDALRWRGLTEYTETRSPSDKTIRRRERKAVTA